MSLSLAILFLIVGTAIAGSISPEPPATDIGLKQVPYNINGVFTTVSGITYDPAFGGFAADNLGKVTPSLSMTGCLRSWRVAPALLCSLPLTINTVRISSAIEMRGIPNCSEAVSSSPMTFSQ